MLSRTNIPRSLASSSRVTTTQASSRCTLHTVQRNLKLRLDAECSKSSLLSTQPPAVAPQVRWTSSSSKPDKLLSQSIFSTPESPWEQLFSESPIHPTTSKPRRPTETSSSRIEMTAQEQKTFGDLFDEIFKAAEGAETSKPSEDENQPAFSSDFYQRIRRTPTKPKFGDEELDKKKEEMDLCRTDQELLDWALVDVFAESRRFEEEARKMGVQTRSKRTVTLQPLWYPHVVALLMRTFRDKYQNPHTALAIFNYTKTASIASYAFGCSTDAYNELIDTYWSCFRDASAVLNAFREMQVNGVTMSSKTNRLLDNIRRDVGAERLWSEDEVSNIITRLDVIRRDVEDLEAASKKYKSRRKFDQWKTQALRDDPTDKWGFNSWDAASAGSG